MHTMYLNKNYALYVWLYQRSTWLIDPNDLICSRYCCLTVVSQCCIILVLFLFISVSCLRYTLLHISDVALRWTIIALVYLQNVELISFEDDYKKWSSAVLQKVHFSTIKTHFSNLGANRNMLTEKFSPKIKR